jgi:predicted RNA-binding protein with PUA-like domain
MAYWLMKSEPDAFSIADLEKKKVASWDGVRNYQARNFMRAMRQGDFAFFYHSSIHPPGIAGVMRIAREAYPDPTQFDLRSAGYDPRSAPENPRWDQVDVAFESRWPELLSLEALKNMPALKGMALFKRSRLSVQPVAAPEWQAIIRSLAKVRT